METNNITTLATTSKRRYDIDAIRVIAFGLLILYHCAQLYVSDWGWHIKSEYQYQWLKEPMIFLNQWRMPLLFVISGMATLILSQRYGTGFWFDRIKKLGIPLLFGIFIVVAPQAYFEAVNSIGYDKGFIEFWLSYISIQDWPEGAFAGSQFGVTWNHLWFLPYIILYTLVFIPLGALLRAKRAKIDVAIERLQLWHWIFLPLIPMLLAWWTLQPLFPEKTHTLYDDWYHHAQSFTYFVLGAMLMLTEKVWVSLNKYWDKLLIIAILCFATISAFRFGVLADLGSAKQVGFAVTMFLNRWLWILVVLALGYRFLNKPSAFFSYATRAIFCWYILHQSITVVAGGLLSPLRLGGVVESMLVVTATSAGCILIHHFVVLKLPMLQVFFGVKRLSKSDSLVQQQKLA
jgi:glucan biosynthesis protein C